MKARKASATVDIKIRMKEPLRRDIERAAKGRQISMNAEMVDRLSRGFTIDSVLGGPALRQVLIHLMAAFADEGDPSELLADPHRYRAAMIRAIGALIDRFPGGLSDDGWREIAGSVRAHQAQKEINQQAAS
jgi:hypothetical protein